MTQESDTQRIEEFRALRQRIGWSQEKLAYVSGVAVQTVSRLERGARGPRGAREATLRAIEAALRGAS